MYIYDGFDIIIIFGGSEINRAHIVQKGLLCKIKYRNDKNVDINILFAFFLHVQCKFARININVGTKLKQGSGGNIGKKGFEAPVFKLAVFSVCVYIPGVYGIVNLIDNKYINN